MNNPETNIPKTKEKWTGRHTLATLAAVALAAAGSIGFDRFSADKPQQATTATAEPGVKASETPEAVATTEAPRVSPEQLAKLADGYQKEALEFAQEAFSKFPEEGIAKSIGESKIPVYEMSVATAPHNRAHKRIWATLEDGEDNSGTLRINAEEVASNNEATKKVLTVFKLKSGVLAQDSDGPVQYKDFRVAFQEVTPQDISSIVAYSKDFLPQTNLDIQPGQSPQFTYGEGASPLADPPIAEDIGVVMDEILR